MKNRESVKRLIILGISIFGLLLLTGVYAYIWFEKYYPIVNNYNRGLKFYYNGHLLMLGVYLILLFFFCATYGGLKISYLKPMDVFMSQVFTLLIVNVITYFQISLMNNWLVPVSYFAMATLVQLCISFIWTHFSYHVYHRIFKPRRLLLVHGHRGTDEILAKFTSRKDKYTVDKMIDITEGYDAICEEIVKGYDAVVLWDISIEDRNKLYKFCYGRAIRIYLMPKIPDVLIKGTEQLHLFDTPIYLTRENPLTIEQRMGKRTIDLIVAVILAIVASPIMLVTAICIKLYDGGPVLYKQVRVTRGRREFKILKFRSMRVDAEKDGVARLASKGDDRITPIGKFIRAVRIDELPQIFNILKGDMSFIGPRPERPEIIEQYLEEMPEFAYRTKVKAGLAGYAQVYGKYNTTPYDKLKLDLTYIENYSVWLDIKLMLLTLKILFKPESTEGVDSTQITAIKDIKEQER